jgi:hypothetical protein
MRGKVASGVVVLLGLAVAAWAGRANYFETSVDLVARQAIGSLYDTRHTPDNVQYIGCYLQYLDGVARVGCEAKDVASEHLSCTSTDPEMVKVAQGLTDNGYIVFKCDSATPSSLTYLYVGRSSVWLP